MQVTETKNEGLSREFAVTVPSGDIEERVIARLEELVHQVKIPGFRPGKVPVKLLRQRYGDAVKGEVLQAAVAESTSKTLEDRELQPAMQPKIEVQTFEEGKDLEFTIAVDILPDIDPVDFRTIELERLKATIDEKQIDDALERMSQDFAGTEPIKRARKSKEGDTLVIDFKGMIDGEAFEGGEAADHQLELGSDRFIPGFEAQLVGKNAGDHVKVEVAFPDNYGNPEFAGKDAVFEVDIKEIREKVPSKIDDDFAKNMGLDDLEALRGQVRERLEGEYAQVARERLKRQLLDKLDEAHDFDTPPGMVEAELESIWNQFETARKNNEIGPDDIDKSDDEMRADYRKIAERRVRLGLLLAAVGQRNNIDITPEEMNRALIRQAQMFPGQERQVIETYQQNENLMASLRAPIFEDKVVDFILEMANITDRDVTPEELFKDPDEAAEEEAAKNKKKSTGKTTRKRASSAAGKKPAAAKSKSAAAGKSKPKRKTTKKKTEE